jgi:hypothetical protein
VAAAPPLPPDDDSIPEGPTLPSVAPETPVKTPTAPADQDSTLGTRDPQTTLISLMNQRSANPTDLGLRDQEHAAFSRYLLERLGPLLGGGVVAAGVPAYSAVKGARQMVGGMKDATPASFGEVKAGLSPLWGGDGGPQPLANTRVLQNQLYTLMRLLGAVK